MFANCTFNCKINTRAIELMNTYEAFKTKVDQVQLL